MNSKRKRIGVYLTVFCLLSLAFSPASAESVPLAEPLTQLFLSGQRLLLEEIEFTAVGQAEFYLDQTLFKHAEGVYAQENTKAYQQIDLSAPREDGSTRENGYAVFDNEGEVYCIERYAGKTIANYSTNPENDHMLRGTVATRMLLRTGASMARVLDAQMAEWVAVSP